MNTPRHDRARTGSLIAIAAIVLLAFASLAAGDPARPGSYCPAPARIASADGLPIACPPRSGQPLSQALGFASVLLAAAWWAPGRRH